MARFKPIHQGLKLLPVDFDRQVIPGSFEYALCHLVDHELDLSAFHARYRNDVDGASAFAPAVLIKIILLAYSRGIISSRKMEAACRENVLFIAVSGDSQPHFTTLAAFVSSMGDTVARLFAQVLLICDRQGLIGREMFAIDGVKLPANASKAKSGTRADYQRQVDKMEHAAKQLLEKHQSADNAPTDEALAKREAQKLERLQKEAQQLRDWLNKNPEDRKGSKGSIRLSNRTDNESAKMATGKGVIQGYTGVAAVDEKSQIIVDAQAHGTGSEQELLLPVIQATEALRSVETVITADAGYHSQANLKALAQLQINAYVPDNGYRKRDERYADRHVHAAKPDPLWNKAKPPKKSTCFKTADFRLAEDRSHCLCPAGKRLYSNGSNCTINGYAAMKFSGAKQDCVPCERRKECLRTPEKTATRQVSFFQGKRDIHENHVDRMKVKIDSDAGREMITRRFATVEPVFGNLRGNKRLHRFTLRGKAKVDGQWKLYCLVHNVEKLANHGYAQ
ncbi:IS1182 family transposase [Noviherbaspirillum cavernae]|uniref:IS1182 family transposase n=1 Tax=Noviherbaspirillum cavernae TaxID=2320862 RepID=A0A418WXZ1_9BURK|nr:IS1182 family transposase [Noviherbaspirillum cavernae]RJG05061.1 IS1182 family transposase [Noviherbaspirillum cavernae]